MRERDARSCSIQRLVGEGGWSTEPCDEGGIGRHHALVYVSAMNRPDDEQVDDDVDVVLRETRRNFIRGFGAACAAMARLIDEVTAETSGASRSELQHRLHRMGGLAGTIGFPTVSARAWEFEDHL